MSSRCRFSTHWASIASASVNLTTRTGSFSSSASFAALRRRAPATTSYLLSPSSRTRRGARIPCVLKLAAFCVVDHFVAEDAKRCAGTGVGRSKGHITCHSRDLTVQRRWGNASRLSDSAKLQFLVCSEYLPKSLEKNGTPPIGRDSCQNGK